jgi:hypothetical protein
MTPSVFDQQLLRLKYLLKYNTNRQIYERPTTKRKHTIEFLTNEINKPENRT